MFAWMDGCRSCFEAFLYFFWLEFLKSKSDLIEEIKQLVKFFANRHSLLRVLHLCVISSSSCSAITFIMNHCLRFDIYLIAESTWQILRITGFITPMINCAGGVLLFELPFCHLLIPHEISCVSYRLLSPWALGMDKIWSSSVYRPTELAEGQMDGCSILFCKTHDILVDTTLLLLLVLALSTSELMSKKETGSPSSTETWW